MNNLEYQFEGEALDNVFAELQIDSLMEFKEVVEKKMQKVVYIVAYYGHKSWCYNNGIEFTFENIGHFKRSITKFKQVSIAFETFNKFLVEFFTDKDTDAEASGELKGVTVDTPETPLVSNQ